MKVSIFFILLLLTVNIGATIYSVSNMPNTDPDFTTLSAAQSAAADGDTLYVYGSSTSYGDFTFNKQLTLIGPGYFLDENPFTQSFPVDAELGIVTFGAGSAGSLISGFSITRIVVNDDNISIIRNRVYLSTYTASPIFLTSGAINTLIAQNYIHWDISVSSSSRLLNFQGNNTDIYVANNIMRTYSTRTVVSMTSTSTAIFENNTIVGGTVGVNNSLFQNNIMITGTFNDNGGNIIRNNIGNSTQFGTDNNNQSNVYMNSVFTFSGSTDGYYSLAPGSPAIGAGVGGVDCGNFGGLSPYVLSGMPAGIPSIYEFNAPSSGYIIPVEIKVQSH